MFAKLEHNQYILPKRPMWRIGGCPLEGKNFQWNFDWLISYLLNIIYIYQSQKKKKFEDTKSAIRSRKSKDRQYNDQNKTKWKKIMFDKTQR